MSDIENRKIQDILRAVAEIGDEGSIDDSWEHTLASLRDEVGVRSTPTWSGDLAACLREIADRIDRQSVVEVQVPPKPEPDSDQPEPSKPSKIGTMRIGVEVDTTQVDEAIEKIRELGGMMTDRDGVTTELDALPMPAIIDVHDCIIEVHVYGSDDDQD